MQPSFDGRENQLKWIIIIQKNIEDKVQIFFMEFWMGKERHFVNQINNCAFFVYHWIL